MNSVRLSDYALQRVGFEHLNRDSDKYALRCGQTTTIGRGLTVDVRVLTKFAGRIHCVLRLDGKRVLVKDNESMNGTFVNTLNIGSREFEIKVNDFLGIGCSFGIHECFEKEDYLVYRLIKIDDVTAKVELLSDDEPMDSTMKLESAASVAKDSTGVISLDDSFEPIVLLSDDETDDASSSATPCATNGRHANKMESSVICILSDDDDDYVSVHSETKTINDDMEHMATEMPYCFHREQKQEMHVLDEYLSQMDTNQEETSPCNSPYVQFNGTSCSPLRDPSPVDDFSMLYDMHSNSSDSSTETVKVKQENESSVFVYPKDASQPIVILDDDADDLLQCWFSKLLENNEIREQRAALKRKKPDKCVSDLSLSNTIFIEPHPDPDNVTLTSTSHLLNELMDIDNFEPILSPAVKTHSDNGNVSSKALSDIENLEPTIQRGFSSAAKSTDVSETLPKIYPRVVLPRISVETYHRVEKVPQSAGAGAIPKPPEKYVLPINNTTNITSLKSPVPSGINPGQCIDVMATSTLSKPIGKRRNSKHNLSDAKPMPKRRQSTATCFQNIVSEIVPKNYPRVVLTPVSIETIESASRHEAPITPQSDEIPLPVTTDLFPINKLTSIASFKSAVPYELNQDKRVDVVATSPPIKRIEQRRKSMCILIDAKPMPKRRQSISAARQDKVVEKTKKLFKQDELRAKFKESRCSSSSKKSTELQESRKSKLKSIAEAQKSVPDTVVRVQTKPKVKVTQQNRGCFLTDDASNPPLPREIKKHKNQSVKTIVKGPKKAQNKDCRRELPLTTDANETTLSRSIDEMVAGPLATVELQIQTAIECDLDLFPAPSSMKRQAHQTPNDQLHPFDDTSPEPCLADYKIIMKPPLKQIKSILSTKRRPKQDIRFHEPISSFYSYTIDFGSDDVLPPNQIQSNYKTSSVAVYNDPINQIISDITSWLPCWLREKSPLINGYGFEPRPIVHNYQSIGSYLDTMLPIMKLELWENIRNEYQLFQMDPPTNVTKNSIFLETRGANMRYVINCQVDQINQTTSKHVLNQHDLVLVSYGDALPSQQFFALITAYRVTYNITRPTASFTMEAAPVEANIGMPAATSQLTVRLVFRLKYDLSSFRSVLQLERSQLLQQILTPKSFPYLKTAHVSFEYRGNDQINKEQYMAIGQIAHRVSMPTPTITLIDGPPGTGKSRVITNLVLQLIYGDQALRPRNLIVCAHSNAAVDVICRKLDQAQKSRATAQQSFTLIRFGMLDKMHVGVRHLSLQNMCKKKHSLTELQDERKTLRLKLSACELRMRNSNGIGSNQEYEMGQLKERLSNVEQAITRTDSIELGNNNTGSYKYWLSKADVICTTLGSFVSIQPYLPSLSVCIVDEATQCPEPSTLIPVSYGIKSLILVGDTQQLPGTVQSQKAKSLGYNKSLFDRIQGSFQSLDNCPVFQLTTQYRMDPEICSWPSKFFYNDRIVSNVQMRQDFFPLKPYTVICLDFKQTEHISAQGGKHYLYNVDEAEFVIRMLRVLSKIVAHDKYSIGIITPYAQQKEQLKRRFSELPFRYLSADTVDAYQGQEKDIIILSTVRSSGVGFLSVSERLNVALTRAKRCLIVCGNFQSLVENQVWHSMLTDAKTRGHIHTIAHERNEELFELTIMKMLVRNVSETISQ